MISEKEENYNFLFYMAVENESKVLLDFIQEKCIVIIETDEYYIDKYCEMGNLFKIKYVGMVSEENLDYRNILFKASKFGYLDIIKYLNNKGINLNFDNESALMTACCYGNLNIVKYLIQNGADIHTKNDYALKLASERGYLNIVKYLVNNNADIHAENDYALKWANVNEHMEIVKYFIQKGSNISNIEFLKMDIRPDIFFYILFKRTKEYLLNIIRTHVNHTNN